MYTFFWVQHLDMYTCMPVMTSLQKANGPLATLTYNHMPIEDKRKSPLERL